MTLTPDPSIAAPLRESLARAGYNHPQIQHHMGMSRGGFVDLTSAPLVMWRTRDGSPLSTLARLFIIGAAVPSEAASAALQPLGLDRAVEAGLLRRIPNDHNAVEAAVAIIPFENLLIAADFSLRPSGPTEPAADHVMGIGRSTLSLARLAWGHDAASAAGSRVLDLGCGCGYLALQAASRGASATGVDINPRAIALSKFNAALNELHSARFLLGNMIEPVAGESFDVILSNPPFVISPETSLIYRDGGASAARDSGGGLLRGDEFCRDAAAACSRLLAPSGLLVMQMNWSHAPGSSWMERLASWAPSSMQRWVLSTDTQAVDEYASMWIRHTMAGTPSWSPSQFERTFAAWMQYYQRLCIEQISYGAYVVRNAAPPCFAADDIDSRWIESGAIDCRSALDARAFAASLGDPSAIRDLRLKPAPALRMHQSLHPSGAEQPSTDTASLTHGPTGRILCTATRAVANLIMRLTGRTTLARAIDESATTLGLSGAEKSAFAESVHAAAFTLLREGGLLPQ